MLYNIYSIPIFYTYRRERVLYIAIKKIACHCRQTIFFILITIRIELFHDHFADIVATYFYVKAGRGIIHSLSLKIVVDRRRFSRRGLNRFDTGRAVVDLGEENIVEIKLSAVVVEAECHFL